jgi:hypothetical protein
MIAGSGEQCTVKTFSTRTQIKLKNDNHEEKHEVFSNEKRNCDCCLVY